MGGLTVLIANATLATFTGTETYVRDLALGLLRKGHSPIVYAPELGQIAQELRRATIPVIDDLKHAGTNPDIIHGNHNTELITALLQFANVPAVFFCHSWTDWISSPPSHPRILEYVAVDDTCRDRLVLENAIPPERVRVRLHGVDLERFKPRAPLPERPARALIFSNNASQWTHLNAVREACNRAGIQLDVVGSGVNASNANPERLLADYDVVFAKARCALEALTVGTAVVLCDAAGSGPLVTSSELDRLQRLNFGIRTLSERVDPELLAREIARYDPVDATEVSRRVRQNSDLNGVVDDAVTLYNEVIEEFRTRPPAKAEEENLAVAEYLRWLTLATRGDRAKYEAILANSPTLRLRTTIGRLPLLDKLIKPLAQLARRNGSKP
jgi:Glycosyltransferase Family 4